MSGQVELTNPVDRSVGGMRGHLLRRGIHLSMIGIPYLYFSHGESVAEAIGVSLAQVVAGVVLIALVLEGIRLKIGLTVFGQRDYEANQVSALAWGAVGIGFVLLLVPEEAYAWPLIASLALGDPLCNGLAVGAQQEPLSRRHFVAGCKDNRYLAGIAVLTPRERF